MSSTADTYLREQTGEGAAQVWWARLLTRQLHFAMDGLVLLSAFTLAYLLRFDFIIPEPYRGQWLGQLPYVVLIQFAALLLSGVYSFIWRYVGIAEVKGFLKAALASALLLVSVRYLLPDQLHDLRPPLSISLIDTFLAFGGVLGLRVLRRGLYERYEKGGAPAKAAPRTPTILIGAGRAGVMAVRELLGNGDAELDIVGFLDDDPRKKGASIYGVKVLGATKDLPRFAEEYDIKHVVISIARASRKDFKRILNICEQAEVKVQVVPSLSEIMHGRVKVSRIRDIEIEDLLGREPVCLEEGGMKRLLTNKVVMVTGAGGSIGSELARQVSRYHPSSLILVERAEFALFNIDRELRQLFPRLVIVPTIADVGDGPRMRGLFQAHRPNVVLHAAAHKHVPMMEENASEAVKNNVLATHLLGDLAGQFGAEAFVLISTDKAVRPTSVMGASKRIAELVVQRLDRQYGTRYMAVRFGNVIGSAGSVIPIFREQIQRGGPVTVTHPDMVRYFMTIPEASQLVIQAAAIGDGGEIFILDMGEPVRILELAKETIALSGLRPYEDIDIVFTGIRPGEKLFEELQTTGEEVAKTRHPKIFIGKIAAWPDETIRRALGELRAIAGDDNDAELRHFINDFLPEASLSGAATRERAKLELVSATSAA